MRDIWRRWVVCGWAATVVSFHVPAAAESPVARTAERTVAKRLPVPDDAVPPPSIDRQTLETVLAMARDGQERIRREVRDYSCIMVKRERVHGRLGNYQYMYAKVRHRRQEADGKQVPFSVYLKFLGPRDVKGREVLFVEGQNEGRLIARKGGLRFAYITTELEPTSDVAMQDNRYPVTEFGFENLVNRFVEVVEEGALLSNCSIQLLHGSKVDGRPCKCIEVRKLDKDASAPFYLARVYIDKELQIPIHYEAFDWPDEPGGAPKLLEQYTYRELKLNCGFTDADFRRDNPEYEFSPAERQ